MPGTLLEFTARSVTGPTTGGATPDVRNDHPVLAFPDGSTTAATFEAVMPRHYAGGTVEVILGWLAVAAVTGNVVWGVAVERHQAGVDDLDVDGYAAEKTVAAAAPATAGAKAYTTVSFTAAEADGVAAGESLRIRVRRLGADASDTLADTVQLHSVELREP